MKTPLDGLDTSDESEKRSAKKVSKSLGCVLCLRKEICKSPMLGRDSVTSEIMIVVSNPTKYDDGSGKAFNGAIWARLLEELGYHGLRLPKWAYANPCHTSEKLTVAQEKRCHSALMKYLTDCGCKYALLVGATAMNIFSYGKHKAITKERGGVITCEGITAVPVSDYADVLRDLELLDTFKADLGFFKRLVTDSFAKVECRVNGKIPNLNKDIMIKHHMTYTPCLAYDIESTGFNHRINKMSMIGVAWRTKGGMHTAILYPKETPFNVPEEYKWEWSDIAEVLNTASRTTAQNSTFDNGWLHSRGVPAHTNLCTMHEAYCENHMMPHDLKFMAKHKLHAPHYNEGIKFDDFSDEMRDKMEYYCQLDCYYTLLLREDAIKRNFIYANGAGSYKNVLAKILMPGTRVLERIEARGVHVDKHELIVTGAKLSEAKGIAKMQLDGLMPVGHDYTKEFNFDSPAQLRKLLYGKKSEGGFGYKPIYKERDPDDDDDPTTGKAALKKLARMGSEFCKELLVYREHSKGLSGFIEPWLEMLGEDGDRLYPRYRLTLATGRSACYDPNLQQVSRLKLIRNLIRPTPGWIFVEADYSQVELRVAAWIGRIHSMLKIYREGGDIHVNTAKAIARLAGKDWSTLTDKEKKEFRQKAKAVNFGFIYGMSADGFVEYADASYDVVLTLAEAKNFRKVYFDLYPELQDWHDRSKRETLATKYVRNPFGFVRRLPNVDSVDKRLVSKAIRCGYNTPVQGTAFYLTLLSMIDLECEFGPMPDYVQIIGQCHDAIFFQINPKIGKKNVFKLLQFINDTMVNPRLEEFDLAMDVPLEVEIKYGRCWSDPENKIFDSRIK